MPFISTSAHYRFMQACKNFINESLTAEKDLPLPVSEEPIHLIQDIDKLQQLADKYMDNFSKLPVLAKEYNTLQHRIKINMRRIRMLQKKK